MVPGLAAWGSRGNPRFSQVFSRTKHGFRNTCRKGGKEKGDAFVDGEVNKSSHDKKFRAGGGGGAVGLGVVGALVRSAGSEGEAAAVGEFGLELAFHAKQNVSFAAPVVGAVAGRIFDEADADVGEGLGTPEGGAGFAGMLGGGDGGPVGEGEGEGWDAHGGEDSKWRPLRGLVEG